MTERQHPHRNARTRQQFVRQINTEWQKAVESIIETGRLLEEAWDELGYGEYGKMFQQQEVGFSERTARMLRAIARNRVLIMRKHASALPASWYSLYLLTKLPDWKLKQMLAEGLINPGMERKDVEQAIKKFEDESVCLAALPSRLNGLIGFMEQWPDAAVLANKILDEHLPEAENVDIEKLKKLTRWIAKLHAACEPKWRRQVQDQERRREEDNGGRSFSQKHEQLRAKLTAEIAADRDSRAEINIGRLKIDLTDHGYAIIPVYLPGADGKRVGTLTVDDRDRWCVSYTYEPGRTFPTIKAAVRAIEAGLKAGEKTVGQLPRNG